MKILTQLLAPLLLTLICIAQLTQWIDPTNSDLARHLQNGQLVLNGPSQDTWGVLRTNYYSYAAPDAPFVNHHWLTGVVFFLVWKLFSFPGLTVLYLTLVAGSLVLAYWAAARASNRWIAAALAILSAPMVAWRFEVRPEAFTYLLLMVFYWILAEWFHGRSSARWLWVLPPLMCLWINLHVAFVFGFLLLGIFCIKVAVADGFAWRSRLGLLCGISLAATIAALANPSGLTGLLYPLGILSKATRYPVAEFASLSVIRARGLWAWEYELFVLLLLCSLVTIALRWRSVPRPDAALLLVLGSLAVMQVRSIPIFLLVMIPVLSGVLRAMVPVPVRAKRQKVVPSEPAWPRYASAACVGVGLLCSLAVYRERSASAHLGLKPGTEAPVAFLRANNIHGPIFNDFDIGGYLIFNLFPERVFVDGRPEAYPDGFFDKIYIPALSDDGVWQAQDEKYNFQTIVISMQDGFPGVEKFILTRVRDEQWAPVYADAYSIIFVRRTEANTAVIEKYQIPRERFR